MPILDKYRRYRFLLEELVHRDFVKKYKRTVLGVFWSVLSPLLTLLVMYFVFRRFFGSSVEHYTIYLFAGNLVFSYFNDATSQGMTSLVENAPIFSKINVPKYLFLISKNVQTLINFLITLGIFLLFCWFDGVAFTWKFALLIYPILCLLAFNIGVGMILSALYIFFRDMQYLWSLFTMLLMYVSAIFYTTDGFSPAVQRLFLANPVYLFIRYFRDVAIAAAVPSLEIHLLMAAYSAAALGAGAFVYKKYNWRFLYYV